MDQYQRRIAEYAGRHDRLPAQLANNMVYIGTDAGVFTSFTTACPTGRLKRSPNVIVDDLQIDYTIKKIRAGTYGRGIGRRRCFDGGELGDNKLGGAP